MKNLTMFSRRGFVAAAAAIAVSAAAFGPVKSHAADMDSIHFIIPGGAGGGWDGTARGTGEALTKSGMVGSASYENMSGGGGGQAIAYMIEASDRLDTTLMVNSTPIIVRSLTGVFPQSFRDLTPIAGVVAEYAAFGVPADSPYQSFTDVVDAMKADSNAVKVGGGSVRGGMDHIVAAFAFQKAGGDAKQLKYVPYDAGGKAIAGLLSGEIDMLSTGLGELLELHKAGQVRILAVTSKERVEAASDVPSLGELGIDAEFINWRGYFGGPSLSAEKADAYAEMLKKLQETEEWEVVRKRNGWEKLYVPRAEFTAFMEEQETMVGGLMRELGFLK
ncbi:tripartite tricarboxylate transporter substrate binding protein [Thalassospira sp.]|uniref:tripartite tricarboxylate transporter substrate binding protein n=1 Tax=Thalassospira sp. TaxID=1912094 RepID=UPI002733DD46|nr:tripartite tricarboxylate transporter substrate-binding protein [Thalassospira sp.]MDP2698434.1 tripartite tricarboxylate transporter substrate-binding protein [Thalassospira sp.]